MILDRRIMTVDVGNKELVEVHVPKTGKVADIMQQLRRWDKDLHGRSLANENGAIVSCTVYTDIWICCM